MVIASDIVLASDMVIASDMVTAFNAVLASNVALASDMVLASNTGLTGTLDSFINLLDKHWERRMFCTNVTEKKKPAQ